MTAFFITVSLILNIVALMAIVILFLRQNKLIQIENKQKKMIKEMEESISLYLLEMKDENEHFIQRIKDVTEEKHLHVNNDLNLMMSQFNEAERSSDAKIKEEFKEVNSQKTFTLTPKLDKTVSIKAAKAYQQQQTQKHEEMIISSPSLSSNEEKQEIVSELKNTPSINENNKANNSDALFQDSLLTQILIMKKEGLSEKEIAKKLNKGRTEIALLLKFRENKQE